MTSTAPRPSGTGRSIGHELPEYQPMSFPLTDQSQASLSALLNPSTLSKIQETLEKANRILSDNVMEINDFYHVRVEALNDRKKRASRPSSQSEEAQGQVEALENEIASWKTRVDDLTSRMDKGIQQNIDAQAHMDDVKVSLGGLQSIARDSESQAAPSTFTPTDPAGSTQSNSSFLRQFTSTLQSRRDRYTSYTPAQRYSTNNSYRTFRRVLHDAQHHDVDCPHESTWFPAPTSAIPGQTSLPDDEDEDIITTRATLSTKCPLTLMEFVHPVTSAKCPHSFEESAIHSLIAGSRLRVNTLGEVIESQPRRGPPTGTPAVRCPVPGCERVLTEADLAPDPVLLRRIARLQRAAQMDDEELDEVERKRRRGGHSLVPVGSSDVSDDEEEEQHVVRRLKRERMSQSQRLRSEEL